VQAVENFIKKKVRRAAWDAMGVGECAAPFAPNGAFSLSLSPRR
jgi:hypothetical protein